MSRPLAARGQEIVNRAAVRRLGEEEALGAVAFESRQDRKLLFVLNFLGDDQYWAAGDKSATLCF